MKPMNTLIRLLLILTLYFSAFFPVHAWAKDPPYANPAQKVPKGEVDSDQVAKKAESKEEVETSPQAGELAKAGGSARHYGHGAMTGHGGSDMKGHGGDRMKGEHPKREIDSGVVKP
jgi:hypothetical protein